MAGTIADSGEKDLDGSLHGLGAAALISAVVAALPEAVMVVGSDDRLICANAAARLLFPGLRDRESVSRGVRAPEILDAVRDVRLRGRPIGATWLDRVPVERQFDVRVAVLGGSVLPGAVLISLHDTTESRRVERMRADFVANASHELRTPLASLLGFVETLQGPAKGDSEAHVKFLAIMGDQARRMSRLVDDLLSLSRIEQSLHMRPDGHVDLASVASHMADALGPMAQDNNVEIRLDAESPVHVQGDRDELLRVAENLIENAIKYGGPGFIDISVREENGSGVFAVEDRGPGIASDHIPRLTERFYRIDAAHSRAKGGTGLGLAIVKHIVARHRGRLTIDSSPEQGSRFTVALPLGVD